MTPLELEIAESSLSPVKIEAATFSPEKAETLDFSFVPDEREASSLTFPPKSQTNSSSAKGGQPNIYHVPEVAECAGSIFLQAYSYQLKVTVLKSQ